MMLSVKEAARQLNISPSTVYALIAGGHLTCHRVGVGRGVIRISQEQIADYLNSCAAVAEGRLERRPPRHRLKHIRL